MIDGGSSAAAGDGIGVGSTSDGRFTRDVLPHLDAAYALARVIVRRDQDAEDVVHDALVRAMRFIDGFAGVDGRAWLLAIVRNTARTWLRRHRAEDLAMADDDEGPADARQPAPDERAIRADDRGRVRAMLERLPLPMREVLVLREVEGLSYRAIADVVGAPIGTVMSRLSRARERLLALLTGEE